MEVIKLPIFYFTLMLATIFLAILDATHKYLIIVVFIIFYQILLLLYFLSVE